LTLAAALLLGASLAPGGLERLAAQSTARVVESVLLPPRFFVGDRVELRLRLEVPARVPVQVPDPAEFPSGAPPEPGQDAGSWVRIERIEVLDRRRQDQEGEVQLRVFFASLTPGEGSLPELELGGVRVPPQEFVTASVRDRETEPEFRPLRSQVLLPLTGLRVALGIVVLLGAPALLILLAVWAIRLLRKLRELHRRRRPAQRARSALQKLAQGLEQAQTREVFVDLSEVLKRYLAERLQVPTASATTAEIDGLLGGVGVSPTLVGRVREVLRTADTVKFSGRAGRRSAVGSSLKKVHDIVDGVEELCDVEP
jgi:hypothetical protein